MFSRPCVKMVSPLDVKKVLFLLIAYEMIKVNLLDDDDKTVVFSLRKSLRTPNTLALQDDSY